MSLFGALKTGVAGLTAQSSAMSIISDNIANVNTVGYKGNSASFSTLVTKQTSTSRYSSGGVQCRTRAGVDIQGLLSSTTYSTDISISGNGFFVATQVSEPEADDMWSYTRVGNFSIDQDGYLKNDNGYYLQAWPLQSYDGEENASLVPIGSNMYMKAYTDDDGTTVYVNDNIIDANNLRPVNLNTIGGTAQETHKISLGANLPADAPVYNPEFPEDGGRYSSSVLIYDSLGNSHNATLTFTKTDSNCWSLDIGMPSGAATFVTYSPNEVTNDSAPDVYSARAQMEFTSIPLNHSYVAMETNGKNYVYEFTTDGTTTYSPKQNEIVTAVDIRSGIVTASDAVERLYDAIETTIAGAGRFSLSPDGRTVEVKQSNAGAAIKFKIATTACTQSAANPDPLTGVSSGEFELPELDWDIKNTARLEFTSTAAADYLNKSVAIGDHTSCFSDTNADIPGAITVNINTAINRATGTVDTVKVVSLLRGKVIENEPDFTRYVASGSTFEINPTSTGTPILVNSGDSRTITFQNTNLAAYVGTVIEIGDPTNSKQYKFIDTQGLVSGTVLAGGYIGVNIGDLADLNMRDELPLGVMNELYSTVQKYYDKNPTLENLSDYLRVTGSTMVSSKSYISTTAPDQVTVNKQTLSFTSADPNDYVANGITVYGTAYTFSKFGVTTGTNIDITSAIQSQTLTFANPVHQTEITIGDTVYEFVDLNDADPNPADPTHTPLYFNSDPAENPPTPGITESKCDAAYAAKLVANLLGTANTGNTLTLSNGLVTKLSVDGAVVTLAETVSQAGVMAIFADRIGKTEFQTGSSLKLTQFGSNPFDGTSGAAIAALGNMVTDTEDQDFIASATNTGVGSAIQVTGKDNGKQSNQPDTDGLLVLANSFSFNNVKGAQSGSLIPSVRFNADGTPKQVNTGKLEIEWANGARDMTGNYYESSQISLHLGDANTANGLTQLSGKFATNYINQDGAKFGNYSGVSISEDGIVTAIFDNGETRAIAQIPLATFVDVNALEALSGNAYIETTMSGNATLRTAGEGGAGLIASSSLENSTVDIAEEFTNMITTQRAYSAASKIITTADSMLDELINIKR